MRPLSPPLQPRTVAFFPFDAGGAAFRPFPELTPWRVYRTAAEDGTIESFLAPHLGTSDFLVSTPCGVVLAWLRDLLQPCATPYIKLCYCLTSPHRGRGTPCEGVLYTSGKLPRLLTSDVCILRTLLVASAGFYGPSEGN